MKLCSACLLGLNCRFRGDNKLNQKVVDSTGQNVTSIYQRWVDEAMKLLGIYDIDGAILKQKSPTCGCGLIYDGTFTGKLISGDGEFTKALKKKGIKIISEEQL